MQRDENGIGLKLFVAGLGLLFAMSLHAVAVWVGLDHYVQNDSLLLASFVVSYTTLIVFSRPLTGAWFAVCDWWSTPYCGRR
jgi:hypothetical protein